MPCWIQVKYLHRGHNGYIDMHPNNLLAVGLKSLHANRLLMRVECLPENKSKKMFSSEWIDIQGKTMKFSSSSSAVWWTVTHGTTPLCSPFPRADPCPLHTLPPPPPTTSIARAEEVKHSVCVFVKWKEINGLWQCQCDASALWQVTLLPTSHLWLHPATLPQSRALRSTVPPTKALQWSCLTQIFHRATAHRHTALTKP